MTNTPFFVTAIHNAPGLSLEKREKAGKQFLSDIIKVAQDAEANPLHVGGKTEDERREIISANIYNACNKAMEKMTEAGRAAILEARDWACFAAYLGEYQSLMFVCPVSDKDVISAAKEILTAYKKSIS